MLSGNLSYRKWRQDGGIDVGCKSKTTKGCVKPSNLRGNKEKSSKFIFDIPDELAKGRLQFFVHCPSSKLPIRDVLNHHKTEPHIEIGAENYINCCYQPNNILPFLKSSEEKYLFLFTTCKSKSLKNHYDKRFIVGYIVKEEFIEYNGHFAVRGTTRLYSFENAYPIERLFPNHKNIKNIRLKKLSDAETKKLLEHFEGKTNILQDCIEEIKRLDKDNKTCLGKKCPYQQECLRWNQRK